MLEPVIGLRDHGRGKGVGLGDVGPGLEVQRVNFAQQIGPGQLQQVVVAFVLPVPGKVGAAVIGFSQVLALKHGAPCAVQNQDAFLREFVQGAGMGHGRSSSVLPDRVIKSRPRVGAGRRSRCAGVLHRSCAGRIGSGSHRWRAGWRVAPFPKWGRGCRAFNEPGLSGASGWGGDTWACLEPILAGWASPGPGRGRQFEVGTATVSMKNGPR